MAIQPAFIALGARTIYRHTGSGRARWHDAAQCRWARARANTAIFRSRHLLVGYRQLRSATRHFRPPPHVDAADEGMPDIYVTNTDQPCEEHLHAGLAFYSF